jgi:hypothetical protein
MPICLLIEKYITTKFIIVKSSDLLLFNNYKFVNITI